MTILGWLTLCCMAAAVLALMWCAAAGTADLDDDNDWTSPS